ncbi:MAG: FxsA family protein [Kineosporiaceae bacterium]|nr:FxsA family protein [Kineosporiaceae bacterium]MBK7624815.1 FxsA family protein [Kineosporiaceae bacterium]MBK8076808.1 FxsA family protein [Kineosporiaceae bacterium]
MRPRTLAAIALTWPVLELALLIQVGQRIGVGPTLLILLASSVLGVSVMRRAGRGALADLAEAGRAGGVTTITADGPVSTPRSPGERLVTALAGVLLTVPGLLGTIAGLVLLIPGVGRLASAGASRLVRRRIAAAGPQARVRVISVDPMPPTTAADPDSRRPAITDRDGGPSDEA